MPGLGLRKRVLILLIAFALFYALAMVVFAQTVVRGKLVAKLREKGVAIARRVASDSVNPMITERYFEVAMMLRDLQVEEQDFVYAFVVDEEGRVTAHTFAGEVPPALRRANRVATGAGHSARELATDRGRVLDIAVPLLHGRAGVLHLGLAEAAIRGDVNEILLLVSAFSGAVLLFGGLGALALSRLVTAPLLRLTAAAESFGRGEAHAPVGLRSGDEIGQLTRVFDEMVENRNRAAAERERLIAELQQALSEVKTLRGFLPICSSCKKIRSDEGYWQQIETYLRDHTGAEFSHGLCPACAKELYPEYWERIRDADSRRS